MRILLASLAIASFSRPATSQSIHVDFEPVPNSNGAVTVYHAAAAKFPGVWNSVSATSVQDLVAASGAPTGVDLAAHSAGTFVSSPNVDSGDVGAVLNDRWLGHTDSNGQGSAVWEFTNLASGDYEVYTICSTPEGGGNVLQVTVTGSPDGLRETWTDTGGYGEGGNFTRHRKTVTDGTIHVRVHAGGLAPSELVINAIQLVRLPEPGENLCPGDGQSLPACPCDNLGGTGRGCQNSAGTGGAWLTTSGSTGPDTIVLHSSRELPHALTIFIQGTGNAGPVIYGDGLRCVSGSFLRLYAKNASGGVASAPGPSDLSITARASALGHPINPGDERYYQSYYRDPNASFCPSPQGATFNASQMVKLVW